MTAPAGGEPGAENQGADENRTFSQDEVNALIEGRLARQKREIEGRYQGFDEIKDKATKFDELTESTKSEIQKANEASMQFQQQAEAAQSELDWANTLLLRQRIAHAKNLDSKLWDRVKGETEEEITADIDDLLTLSPSRPKPGGLRSGATATDLTTAKERAAAAFRNIREAR